MNRASNTTLLTSAAPELRTISPCPSPHSKLTPPSARFLQNAHEPQLSNRTFRDIPQIPPSNTLLRNELPPGTVRAD